jgi:predicted aconitase
MIRLNKEQEEMLAGNEGRGAQKAMEILTAMGNAIGVAEMVKISYAHLMPRISCFSLMENRVNGLMT